MSWVGLSVIFLVIAYDFAQFAFNRYFEERIYQRTSRDVNFNREK